MDKNIQKQKARQRRKIRGRKRINGTPERPRLCVYRSNAHWYAQVIDDTCGKVLVAASTLEKELAEGLKSTSSADAARRVGAAVAGRALEKGIDKVVFDKNGFLYHGRVKGLADAAREAGLNF